MSGDDERDDDDDKRDDDNDNEDDDDNDDNDDDDDHDDDYDNVLARREFNTRNGKTHQHKEVVTMTKEDEAAR